MPSPADDELDYLSRFGQTRVADARSDSAATSVAMPHLITNPAHDDQFRRFAHTLREHQERPDELESALRERYPAAVVHERVLSGEPWLVWYVYRDGHWVARSGQ